MLPWIRGWGADVEVSEPEWLRESLMGEVRAMARQYGLNIALPKSDFSTLDEFFGE
jgi:CRISPR-associated endonuclease/helicase Cas3